MVAKLKLKEIDGRAPQGVNPNLLSRRLCAGKRVRKHGGCPCSYASSLLGRLRDCQTAGKFCEKKSKVRSWFGDEPPVAREKSPG